MKGILKNIAYATVAILVGVLTYIALEYFGKHLKDKKEFIPLSSDAQTERAEKPSVIVPEAKTQETLSSESVGSEMGMQVAFDDSEELIDHLIQELGKVQSEKDLEPIAALLGKGDESQLYLEALKQIYAGRAIEMDKNQRKALVGDVVPGQLRRWELHFADGKKMQIDTRKGRDKKWQIDHVKFSEDVTAALAQNHDLENLKRATIIGVEQEALAFSRRFVHLVSQQDFLEAKKMLTGNSVSDAKLAGLCIIFEEGNYTLNQKAPVQTVRLKDTIGAFFVNLDASGAEEQAQFSVHTTREKAESDWKISEVNLDRLLGDYAKRVAGGDVHFTPLIKNPAGGDTLVIYFDFDSDGLSERTKLQLNIVAGLLKMSATNSVKLSGHTDSKGTTDYNIGLSRERAAATRAYLLSKGVAESQIVTEAHGFSQPRLPDNKEGHDDPAARRVNRRTEIYLDF